MDDWPVPAMTDDVAGVPDLPLDYGFEGRTTALEVPKLSCRCCAIGYALG
jgi:hypothetical protein